jgi:CheY-like chemotaxis protein/anti-sigma regulatory factor (Ser/Thr protein kinase)
MREFTRHRESQINLLPVKLNASIQQVIDLTRARWNDMPQQRGAVIVIQTRLDPKLPVIMGVDGEIREALTNLFLNAFDAMSDGGTLTLKTSVNRYDQVCVEVTDSGMGMSDETRRKCLEPFFTTKGERGTGLGLAMVYGVMQRHNAEVEIESAIGKGTTFRLNFPMPTGMPSGLPDAPAPPVPPQCLRILIVDDDPMVAQVLKDTLEIDGHILTTANGGQAGIDTFLASLRNGIPFDLVVTDLGMPYVDGHRVAAKIKEASRFTPLILLTGWGQRLNNDGETPPNVDRVLGKPPKLSELRAALANCLLKAVP